MFIWIWRPMISSSFLPLSQGFYAIFPFLFPSSDHFSIMCAIDYAIIKHSEAQFHSRQMDSTAPSSRSTPSWSASTPSSSSDVSLGDVMVQLQRMDARLDTLSMELYQVNVHFGCIARRQASMGEFAPEATPLHHFLPWLLIMRMRMMMMVMTMMLPMMMMMMMEMLALPMRCLLDTLTLCHL